MWKNWGNWQIHRMSIYHFNFLTKRLVLTRINKHLYPTIPSPMTFEQFQNKLDQAIKRISRTQWTYFGVAVGVLAIAIVAYNLNNNTPTDQLADNGMPGMHAMIDHKGLTTNPRIPVNPGKPDQPPHRFIPDPNLYGYGYGYGY